MAKEFNFGSSTSEVNVNIPNGKLTIKDAHVELTTDNKLIWQTAATGGGQVILNSSAFYRGADGAELKLGSSTNPWNGVHSNLGYELYSDTYDSTHAKNGSLYLADNGFIVLRGDAENQEVQLTSAAFNPKTVRGLTLGTSSVPWASAYIGTALYFKNPSTNTANIYSNAAQMISFRASNESGYYIRLGVYDSTWTFAQESTTAGQVALGTTNHRWGRLYTNQSPSTSSDRRVKKEISEFDNNYLNLFYNLKPVHYKKIDENNDKIHFGFIAQDVEDSLNKFNLNSKDFGVLEKEPTEDGNDVVYGLAYEEFISLATFAIQEQKKEIETLKQEIETLRGELNERNK